MPTAAQKIETLREEIRGHDYAYYTLAKPTVSDQEYDRLMRELIALETEHPDLKSPDSPTQAPGAEAIDEFASVEHRERMLSIDNTYDEDDFRAFDARVREGLGIDAVEYAVEPKIDGVACSLRYENGELITAATRGDGRRGDDITHNVRVIPSIPKKLRLPAAKGSKHRQPAELPLFESAVESSQSLPRVLEVRGEIFIGSAAFQRENLRVAEENERIEEENKRRAAEVPPKNARKLKPIYANPRNFTAGVLKRKKPRVEITRALRFVAHGLGEVDGINLPTYLATMEIVKALGIPVAADMHAAADADQAWAAIRKFDVRRGTLDYATDGMVVKVNSLAQRDQLGLTSKSPRWAIAFKYPAEQVQTTLNAVTWQVGKYGTLTPVAELSPVFVAGTTVRRATLHNPDQIKRLDLHLGDTVVIEKAGEIIPQVVRAIEENRKARAVAIESPTKCPSCGEPVSIDPEEAALRCDNPVCPAQVIERIKYFADRKQMDIDGLGEQLITQLVEEGKLRTVADLYRLKVDDIASLSSESTRRRKDGELIVRRVGDAIATPIIKSIDKSKSRGLASVLAAIAIRHVGTTSAREIAAAFDSIEALGRASASEINAAMRQKDNDDSARRLKELSEKLHRGLKEHRNSLLKEAAEVGADTKGREGFITDVVKRVGLGGRIKERRAKLLAAEFATARAFVDASDEEIKAALEDSLIVAESVVEFLHSKAGKALVDDLQKQGVSFRSAKMKTVESELSGKSVVITGKFEAGSRPDLSDRLAKAGAKVASAVSKATHILIAGTDAGSKLDRAKELGTPVWDEQQLIQFFERAGV
jgi:DNA ligase (NAD+)